MFKVNNKDNNKDANGVVLVSLLLTLNIFHILLWCFHRKSRLGNFLNPLVPDVLYKLTHTLTNM